MKYLRIVIRLLLLTIHILLGLILCLIFFRNAPQSWFRQHVVPWWLRVVGRIVGLRMRIDGHSAPSPVFLIANHISWLDIIVIGGLQATSFLSKSEVMRWPVISYLANHSGTLYIKRGEGVSAAMTRLSTCLQQGMSTAVFPEGTTSFGQSVQRFYPRLFAPAIDIGVMVQPLAIVYPSPISSVTTNPIVPLKQQATFIASVLAIVGQPYTNVIVRYTKPLPAVGERKLLAQQAWEEVSQAFAQSYGR